MNENQDQDERRRYTQLSARWALLAYGFRPFFLLAGIYGALGPPVLLATYTGLVEIDLGWPVTLWHGHEMIFGFVVAAIAGFLFTAVANWTGRAPVRGATLGALVGLWLAGRLAMAFAGALPAALVAVVDLALLPVLAALALGELIAGRNRRNLPFPALLMVLFVANLLTHLERLSGELGLRTCRFAGFREDIPNLLSLMDVFALPSILEGFPQVLRHSSRLRKVIGAERI